MATKKVCDRCGKIIEVDKKTALKMSAYRYKLLNDSDYSPYYYEYDLCRSCGLDVIEFLNPKNEVTVTGKVKI